MLTFLRFLLSRRQCRSESLGGKGNSRKIIELHDVSMWPSHKMHQTSIYVSKMVSFQGQENEQKQIFPVIRLVE